MFSFRFPCRIQNIAENFLLNFVIYNKYQLTSGFCINRNLKKVDGEILIIVFVINTAIAS